MKNWKSKVIDKAKSVDAYRRGIDPELGASAGARASEAEKAKLMHEVAAPGRKAQRRLEENEAKRKFKLAGENIQQDLDNKKRESY